MKKVCCFGEVLMRISPQEAWISKNQLNVYIGGAEGNVAAALANWGIPVKYCTVMPDNYIGRDIEQYLLGRKIDTSAIIWQGERVGLYYMQQGADLKHAGVVYDRFHSSFYNLKPGTINWDDVLEDVLWFHFSAISPALNPDAVAVCKEALEAATRKNITISVDLNYRAKLWKYGKTPLAVMPELATYCDVIMGNIWAAHTMLGTTLDKDVELVHTKENYLAHAEKTSAEILQKFPRCKTIAYSFRFDETPNSIRYYGALYEDHKLYTSPEFHSAAIVDKAGSGDCFMGGLIYGKQQQHEAQEIINFAAAAAFGKLNETGDASSQTIEDVKKRTTNYA
jgi:2-dehydro-3-deoxygluconokinase